MLVGVKYVGANVGKREGAEDENHPDQKSSSNQLSFSSNSQTFSSITLVFVM